MFFTTDFHIHSKYSNSTSKFMDLVSLSRWARFKGIHVMGTGDFTHPLWNTELKEMLEPAEQGLFQLKPDVQATIDATMYDSCKNWQRFILSSEISTIFKRNGRCYRTHSLVLAPSFQVADVIAKELAKIGNIVADGRPILGMDVKDLVKIALNASPDCMVIPAHIWAPWYGMLGSKSGFDSVSECFQELTDHIYALESGLSASLLMNARRSELDRFALLSNSDAHSVQKLGREANIFDTELSYGAIIGALRANDSKQLVAGIELFPELGKYYSDGHRECGVVRHVLQSDGQKFEAGEQLCVVCKKQLTIGVARRVAQLADRTIEQAQLMAKPSYKIVPLLDILENVLAVPETSKKISAMYHHMLEKLGNEFFILLQAPIADIAKASTPSIARAIEKVRNNEIVIHQGYDGQYGTIQF